jgi:hypothetical protein
VQYRLAPEVLGVSVAIANGRQAPVLKPDADPAMRQAVLTTP